MYSSEEYVCHWLNDAQVTPVAGPFRDNRNAVEFINLQADPTRYGVASRGYLVKHKLYPRNKAGNAKLQADMLYPALAESFEAAIGRCSFAGGYEPEKHAAAKALLPPQ